MTSRRPNSSTARLTIAATSSSLLTSHLTAIALTGSSALLKRSLTMSAVCWHASRLMSAKMRFAPSEAKRIAHSRPIPLNMHDKHDQVKNKTSATLVGYVDEVKHECDHLRTAAGDDSHLCTRRKRTMFSATRLALRCDQRGSLTR